MDYKTVLKKKMISCIHSFELNYWNTLGFLEKCEKKKSEKFQFSIEEITNAINENRLLLLML